MFFYIEDFIRYFVCLRSSSIFAQAALKGIFHWIRRERKEFHFGCTKLRFSCSSTSLVPSICWILFVSLDSLTLPLRMHSRNLLCWAHRRCVSRVLQPLQRLEVCIYGDAHSQRCCWNIICSSRVMRLRQKGHPSATLRQIQLFYPCHILCLNKFTIIITEITKAATYHTFRYN